MIPIVNQNRDTPQDHSELADVQRKSGRDSREIARGLGALRRSSHQFFVGFAGWAAL
jgi:hypothetical protein